MRKRRGFTLIELMVVIAILAILVVSGIASFTSSQQKSRDTRRKNDLSQIRLALETYYSDIGSYPLSDATTGKIKGCIDGNGVAQVCDWGSTWKNLSKTPSVVYMITLPADPTSANNYYYLSDGTYFKLYARLDNTKDTDTGVKLDPPGYVGTTCKSSTVCTYGISSSNETP